MSVERWRAIVLRRTNYGEADRILNLLTPAGQRSVIARGVRREKSKLAGGIELFAVSDVVLTYANSSDMGILTSARLERFFGSIVEDFDKLQFGYEVTNLVAKASSGIEDPGWFEVLEGVYDGLDSASITIRLVQCWFYLRYAGLTGYGFNLERDVAGEPLESGANYMYDNHEQALRRAEQGDIDARHIKFMRLLQAKPIRVVAQIGGVDDIIDDCWMLARQHAGV